VRDLANPKAWGFWEKRVFLLEEADAVILSRGGRGRFLKKFPPKTWLPGFGKIDIEENAVGGVGVKRWGQMNKSRMPSSLAMWGGFASTTCKPAGIGIRQARKMRMGGSVVSRKCPGAGGGHSGVVRRGEGHLLRDLLGRSQSRAHLNRGRSKARGGERGKVLKVARSRFPRKGRFGVSWKTDVITPSI